MPDHSDSAVPAHEEEDKSNNTENTDYDSQASEDSCSTEGRWEDGSKIIQVTTTDFSTILAKDKI